jgi:hypothetical protein
MAETAATRKISDIPFPKFELPPLDPINAKYDSSSVTLPIEEAVFVYSL